MAQRPYASTVTLLAAAALLALACRDPVRPLDAVPDTPAFNTIAAVPLETSGDGAIGSSLALPGMNRQEFDFFITSPPAGRFFIRDYGTLRTSMELLASMTVDPADPTTGISQFEQISATCVTFGGIGRVDTGDRFAFSVTACDNGTPGAGMDFFSISVPEIRYEKAASLTDGEIAVRGATKGDIEVATVTTGAEIDPDGYTVTLDSTTSRPIGPNATVAFNALAEGTYRVQLSGLAANCAVSDSSSRTVTVTAGSVSSTGFNVTCTATTTTQTFATGRGVIGTDPALPRMNRFELDFDVTSELTGRIVLTDYAVLRSDGSVATMTVDPADPATFISSFDRPSATCVAFSGVGRLNDGGTLERFFIDACDNASPGAGADTFQVDLPDRPYSKSGTLTEGDIAVTTS